MLPPGPSLGVRIVPPRTPAPMAELPAQRGNLAATCGRVIDMHSYGLVPDTHDPRDRRFSLVANDLGVLELPRSVDLRPMCSPVRSQNDLGACTAFAIVSGLRECLLVQAGQFVELSPLFLYFWERSLERSIGQDSGVMLRDGMRLLRKLGVPPERSRS